MRKTLNFAAFVVIAAFAVLFLALMPSPSPTAPVEPAIESNLVDDPQLCGPLRAVPQDMLVDLYAEAFIVVESCGDDRAVGGSGDVGCLQITPVVVADCNRILGFERFTLEDRYDRELSKEMFRVIQWHYNPGMSLPLAVRRWNPGAGDWYYGRVMAALTDLYALQQDK